MYEINVLENNRLQMEQEYMALLLNHNELFGITQVKEEYLSDYENRMTFKYTMESYENIGFVEVSEIVKRHPKFNMEYYAYLLNDVLFESQVKDWEVRLDYCENKIIKYYKQDVLNRLIEKLNKGQITYDVYMQKTQNLNDIEFKANNSKLNAKEMREGINEEKSKIYLNCFPKLSNYLNLVQGDFLIIGAKTGGGKSSFMLNIMSDLMNTFQCIYFNMEMSKSTIYKRLIAINANVYVDSVDHVETDYQANIIEDAMKRIEKAGLIIDHKASDVKSIRSVLMKNKDKTRHTVLFIDHLGLTRCDNAKSLYEQITEVAKELRQMCLEYDCTIIGASQLNRTAYASNDLSLQMLKDSGELENSASKVILISQKDESQKGDTPEMKISIVKNRDGKLGNILMDYDKKKQIFKEKRY